MSTSSAPICVAGPGEGVPVHAEVSRRRYGRWSTTRTAAVVRGRRKARRHVTSARSAFADVGAALATVPFFFAVVKPMLVLLMSTPRAHRRHCTNL